MPKAPKQVAYPAIPMDTFNNFFCLNLNDAFSDSLIVDAPNKSRELITCILEGIGSGLKKEKERWEQHSPSEKTRIAVKTTENGSFFIHTSYDENGVIRHQLISGIATPVFHQGQQVLSFDIHSLFCGYEVQNSQGHCLAPSICLCRAYVDDDEQIELMTAATEDQFYAFACYIRHTAATCIADAQINLDYNMAWLTTSFIGNAKESFNDLLGIVTVDEVIGYYHGFENAVAKALKEDGDDDDFDGEPSELRAPLYN